MMMLMMTPSVIRERARVYDVVLHFIRKPSRVLMNPFFGFYSSTYPRKMYASVTLIDFEVTLRVFLVHSFLNRLNMSSYSIVFRIYRCILRSFGADLILIIFSTTSRSSSVNSPSLTRSWLLIILKIGVLLISGGFLRRFLKWSFYFFSLSSCLATSTFVFAVFSRHPLHVLSAELTVIIYLRPNFYFY